MSFGVFWRASPNRSHPNRYRVYLFVGFGWCFLNIKYWRFSGVTELMFASVSSGLMSATVFPNELEEFLKRDELGICCERVPPRERRVYFDGAEW